MQHPNHKSHLLHLMQTEHTRLETLLRSLSEEQMLQANIAGTWSVKDILAHLTWWGQAMISEIVHSVELDPGLQGEPWSTDRANALTVEAKRLTPLPQVLGEFHNSYQHMLHVVEEMSEDQINNEEFYTRLANNTGNHYAEHLQAIEAALHLHDKGSQDTALPTAEPQPPGASGTEQPLINIVGEKVALGPFQRGLMPFLYRWLNDFEVAILSGDPLRPATMESIEAEYASDSKNERRDRVNFIIYERTTMRLIGLTELRRIDQGNRTATFGILIGEKDCWNKGYGTETTTLMLDYGFTILGLHNIMLDTYSYHASALRAYTRAGFRLIGHRREAYRWGNRIYDQVFMDCLSTEFQRPAKPLLELP